MLGFWFMSSFLQHVQVVGVEDGGVVGIEEGGVSVAVEEGAVQVNHMKAFKFICFFKIFLDSGGFWRCHLDNCFSWVWPASHSSPCHCGLGSPQMEGADD